MSDRTDTDQLDAKRDLRKSLATVIGRMMAWRRGDATPKECANTIVEARVGVPMSGGNQVGPHEYVESRRWWQFWRRDFCRACYMPHISHPTGYWGRARPIGDTRTAMEVMIEERHEVSYDEVSR